MLYSCKKTFSSSLNYIYADFDWLKEIELIGELGYKSLRGTNSYSFKFADSWIKKYNAIALSDDLNNYPGIQYTQPEKDKKFAFRPGKHFNQYRPVRKCHSCQYKKPIRILWMESDKKIRESFLK